MRRRFTNSLVFTAFAALAATCASCGSHKTSPAPETTTAAATSTTSITKENAADSSNAPNVAFDLTRDFKKCMLGHRGALLDFGDQNLTTAFGLRTHTTPLDLIEREGATWMRMHERKTSLDFLSPSDVDGGDAGLVIEARARGIAAKTLLVSINGKQAATLTLDKTKAQITSARATGVALVEGRNEVTLSFGGVSKAGEDTFAELDWIHIGVQGDETSYSAPTRADALTKVTLHGEAKSALSLRGPGYAACTTFISAGMRMNAGLAITQGGEADVVLRLHRDRASTEEVASFHLGAAESTAWKPVDVALQSAGTIGELEFAVTRSTKGARVLIGDARITRDAAVDAAPPSEAARGVILVVLGEASPRALAAFGGRLQMPTLDALAARGSVFDADRNTTTLTSGALASMLTGVLPRAHGVVDQGAKLASSVTTLADAARQAGIDTAMFTANPLTGKAFGFDRGFQTFISHAPMEESPATQVFDDAAKFLEGKKDERFFIVIHARGAHPPWDATADELKALAPDNYSGGLDARHAAELMSKARRIPPMLRFQDADRARAWALADLSLANHDKALGRLMQALKANGQDATTAIIVTADLAADETAHVPFGDPETLDEQLLDVPLVVIPPASAANASSAIGKRVTAPTTSTDISVSVLAALGLEAPAQFRGRNLFTLAKSAREDLGRGRLATYGPRFSGRIGPFVMTGALTHESRLCSLELEPTCTTDVRATHPIAEEALRSFVLDANNKVVTREGASLDPDTLAALRAWGL